MAKLSKIKVSGYKSIKDAELSFGDINILIGPNAVGKTNFVSLFNLFNSLANQELQNYVAKKGGADSIAHYGSKTTPEINFDIHFNANSYEAILEPTDDDRLLITSDYAYFQAAGYKQPYSELISLNTFESNLRKHASGRPNVAKYVRKSILDWKVYHFHDTSDSALVKKTCDLDDNFSLKKDASNLSAFLYRLKKTSEENFLLIERTIKRIFPNFGEFILEPSRLNEDKIKLEWKEEGNDNYFDANSLSDGTIRFISLATLLLQPTLPSTVIIDEPELGLHPKAISILASLFRKASHRTQLIISTQSVNLVNEFNPEDIIILNRSDKHTTFSRLDEKDLEQWLNEYSLGELWEKNIIGGRP